MQPKAIPRGSNDALGTPEGITGDKRSVRGSQQRNPCEPKDVLGDEKEADMGARGAQKGVQIRGPRDDENRALAAARAQSSSSED